MRLSLLLILAFAAAGVLPSAAFAHRTSLTRSEIVVNDKTVLFVLRATIHDMAVATGMKTDLVSPIPKARFEKNRAGIFAYFNRGISVQAQGRPCPSRVTTLDFAAMPDDIQVIGVFDCPQKVVDLTVGYRLFFEIDKVHRGLARIMLPEGAEEFVFDRNLTTIDLYIPPRPEGSDSAPVETAPTPAPPAAAPAQAGTRAGGQSTLQRFGRLLILGIEHILAGYDHILFLIALIIGAPRLWAIVKVVTAFTIAHSITLALAWYGLVDVPSRIVEVLIALSIAYVALENILGRGLSHRWMVAGSFGLVHGLGFYSVLKELGMSSNMLLTLLGFNLGVEAGQLFIVALLMAPLMWWRKQAWHQKSLIGFSLLILAIALWWSVQRAFLV